MTSPLRPYSFAFGFFGTIMKHWGRADGGLVLQALGQGQAGGGGGGSLAACGVGQGPGSGARSSCGAGVASAACPKPSKGGFANCAHTA